MSTGCEYNKEIFQHSFERRKYGHNYKSPCRYHIILKKNPDFQKFGDITGSSLIPYGEEGCADIALNLYGKIIKNSIEKFPSEFSFFKTINIK